MRSKRKCKRQRLDVNILLCFHHQIKDFMMFKMENYCLVGSYLERNVTVSEECCPSLED